MSVEPDLAPDEPMRLQALRALNLVDTPLDERFERLTRLAKRLLDVDIVAVSLVEADRQYFKSIQGSNRCQTSRGVSFCGHAILEDEIFIVEDARADERFKDNPLVTGPPHVVFYAGVQLRSPDGFKVGMLCVNHSDTYNFTETDKNQLRDIAALVELEMQAATANAVQAALVEEVSAEQRRALIDQLTRVWNRKGILDLAEETLRQARLAGDDCGLMMLDLDKFKHINDTYGHNAGDEVLRTAAKRMLSSLRETDMVGRLGGDEFLCVLSPCDSESVAKALAERLGKAIAAEPVRTPDAHIPVSASIGVTLLPAGWGGGIEDAMEEADKAMYASKSDGRNCVSVSTSEQKAA